MEQILVEFYISISTSVFYSHQHLTRSENINASNASEKSSGIRVNQAYMRMRSFGQCAIRKGNHELYCIFNDLVPVYAYIGLANETLEKIIKGNL
jgi:hypothetical protein